MAGRFVFGISGKSLKPRRAASRAWSSWVISLSRLARLVALANSGGNPGSDFVLKPTEGPIGQGHAGRELPCTFQTLSLGARKPGNTANLALAKETVEGKHWINGTFH